MAAHSGHSRHCNNLFAIGQERTKVDFGAKRLNIGRTNEGEVLMRLNTAATAVAFGILWGACLLLVGVANMIWPSYGQAFLQLCASIYPGYHPGTGVGSVVIGTIYAFVDGLVGGAIFGWLYNLIVGE